MAALPKKPILLKAFAFLMFSLQISLVSAEILHWGVPIAEIIDGASRGDAQFQFEMGNYHENGWRGLPKDLGKARDWYLLAARQEHARANLALGNLYQAGELEDQSLACSWFEKAANSGVAEGQRKFALCLDKKKDIDGALTWLQRAAAQGDADSAYRLGIWYSAGGRVGTDKATSCKWLKTAADRGHRLAKSDFRERCGTRTDPPRQAESADKQPRSLSPQSTGSGFVVSKHGDAVTNAHVVDGCAVVRVAFDGKLVNASVAVSDPDLDLALLRIEAKSGEVAPIERKDTQQGTAILALGYPYADVLSNKLVVSQGIVAALDVEIDKKGFMMFTAPVQPGNSGGPLLNMLGSVVGVVTAKLNPLKTITGGLSIPEGASFAINKRALSRFLKDNDVDYHVPLLRWSKDAPEIVSMAQHYVIQAEVSCFLYPITDTLVYKR